MQFRQSAAAGTATGKVTRKTAPPSSAFETREAAPVGLDDRPADGEPDAGPALLRGEERLEYGALQGFRDTGAMVPNLHLYSVCTPQGGEDENALVLRQGSHRVHAVHDEIQQDLLQLDPVGRNQWKLRLETDQQADAPQERIVGDVLEDFGHQLVDVDRTRRRSFLGDHRAQLVKNLARPVIVLLNIARLPPPALLEWFRARQAGGAPHPRSSKWRPGAA